MFARYRDTANIICISPMGESAWSYVESTTVLSDYEDDYYERPDSFYFF